MHYFTTLQLVYVALVFVLTGVGLAIAVAGIRDEARAARRPRRSTDRTDIIRAENAMFFRESGGFQ